MFKNKFNFNTVPGWVYTLLIFGFLYFTGLHTEAIALVQRLLLFSGVMKPDLPEKAAQPFITNDDAGTMAGAGFTMQNLQGETIAFESLKGKVIFLNIWATWCPPCIAEMPGIQRLYDKVGSDKIAFVMLAVDENGENKVKRFISKKGYTMPVYLPANQLPQEFYSPSIPTTFIISPEGKIVAKHEGMADYDTSEMQEYLQQLAR